MCQIRASILRCGLGSLLFACLFWGTAAHAAASTQWALMVGVSRYPDQTIRSNRFAGHGARAVAACLVQSDGYPANHVFTLTTDSNEKAGNYPTKAHILARLKTLVTKIQPGDTLLFYFSGQLFQQGNRRFLGCADIDPSSPETLKSTGISLEDLRDRISAARVRQLAVICDRVGKQPSSAGGAPSGKDLIQGLESLVKTDNGVEAAGFILADSSGWAPLEQDNQDIGVFARLLIQGLEGQAVDPATGDITIRALGEYLSKQVRARSVRPEYQRDPPQEPVEETLSAREAVLAHLAVHQENTDPPEPGAEEPVGSAPIDGAIDLPAK